MLNKKSLVVLGLFVLVSVSAIAADPAPAKPGPKADQFAAKFDQWKDMLTKLSDVRIQYHDADAKRRTELEGQWKDLLEKATVLQDELIAAAEDAYTEAPNADPKVTDLLVGLLNDWNERDDAEKALQVGKLLMDHGCKDPVVPNLAGIAAFSANDFDTAEKCLQAAEKLTPAGQTDLAELSYYKDAWAKEQKLREAEAKADDLPRVLLKTSKGDIELELFENEAPNSVANFLTLVDKGFYNGLAFHRVLGGFMAQGGCPKGDGTGDPGYQIPGEFKLPNHRLHFRGSLAMARSQDPDSAGSQFFLMFCPKKDLDGNYTVFGRMTKGFDVLAKIQRRDPDSPNLPNPDKIIEAKVLRKRPHEYTVKKTGG